METQYTKRVCMINITCIETPSCKRYSYKLDRSGATSQTYTVPNSDSSAGGSYTCIVAVHTIESSESSGFSLGVTGIAIYHLRYVEGWLQ